MKKRSFERSMFRNAPPEVFRLAESLRNNMTDPEKHLWSRLKNKQLGVRFKAQHPIGCFITDFYSHKANLAIEIDGEAHKFQKNYDKSREAEIEKYGIKIIRFDNKEILEDIETVIKKIKNQL